MACNRSGLIFLTLGTASVAGCGPQSNRVIGSPTPPYKAVAGSEEKKLAVWLEGQLSAMAQSCSPEFAAGISLVKPGKKKGVAASAVPTNIRLAFGLSPDENVLGDTITESNGSDLANFFGYVFTPNEIKLLQMNDPLNALENVAGGDLSTVNIPGVDGLSYIQTCATVLKSAIDTSSGYTLPVASISASLSADYSGSSSFSTNIIEGTFKSPIVTGYLNQPNSPFTPFHAAMILFSWYEQHPTRIEQENILISSLSAAAAARQAGLKRKAQVDANMQLKAGIPAISSQVSASVVNDSFESLQSQKYFVAIRHDSAGPRINKLPLWKINDVIARANEAGRALVADDYRQIILRDRSAKEIPFEIRGVPKSLCAQNGWVPAQVSNLAMNISTTSSPTPGFDENGKPVCRVKALVKPNQDYVLLPEQVLKLSFNQSMSGNGQFKIMVPADEITFRGLDRPDMTSVQRPMRPVVESKATPVGGAPVTTLAWKWSFQLLDNGVIGKSTDIDISKVNMICPGNDNLNKPVKYQSLDPIDGTSKKFSLTLLLAFDGDFDSQLSGINFLSCDMVGDVVYTLSDNTKLTKAFPASRLEYPVSK